MSITALKSNTIGIRHAYCRSLTVKISPMITPNINTPIIIRYLEHFFKCAFSLSVTAWYNCSEKPTKQAAFPQYKYPQAKAKYAQLAKTLGLKGNNDDELFNSLIEAIEELKKEVEVPASIKDAGVKEEDFLASLDEMSEKAFDDQCTGCNPRYPLISEIKDLYLKCYYGK